MNGIIHDAVTVSNSQPFRFFRVNASHLLDAELQERRPDKKLGKRNLKLGQILP
jgi:hypothetical protein